MKRVIITGASGFVGANLARRLVSTGHDVHLLVREGSDLWRLKDLHDHFRFHYLSLSDRSKVEKVVGEIRPEWVFHLAAHGAYSWQNNLFEMIDTNVSGLAALIEACLKTGFEAFVNTGSSSEYGLKDHAPPEDEQLEPNSYYAVTKASATLLCRQMAIKHKVHIPTLRLYSVYGPYEDWRRLMPTLIMHGLQKRLPVLVNPSIARDYIHIDDVLETYLLAATQKSNVGGPIYNVGSGVQTSIENIVNLACTIFGITEEPQWGSMPNRAWDSSSWVADNRKIRLALGWEPRYSVEQGFNKMVQWFKANPNLTGNAVSLV